MDKPKESDWRAFRDMVPELRERYLAKINADLVAALSSEAGTDTERFWDAEEKIGKEAKILQECLDDHSRSSMFRFINTMLAHGMMDTSDLDAFGEELRERIRRLRSALS